MRVTLTTKEKGCHHSHYIYIYIYNKFYLKVAIQRGRKQVSWFLIFNIFRDVLWQFCYQIQSQVLWPWSICLFETQGNVWKLRSAIFEYKVKFLNKKLCSMNCGGSKKLFGNMWLYIHGLDKYNTVFQNVKRVLHQNKAHTKIS